MRVHPRTGAAPGQPPAPAATEHDPRRQPATVAAQDDGRREAARGALEIASHGHDQAAKALRRHSRVASLSPDNGPRFEPEQELRRLGVRLEWPVSASLAAEQAKLRAARKNSSVSFKAPLPGSGRRATTVKLVSLADYQPDTSPGARRTLADPRLLDWLRTPEAGTARNYEASDLEAVARHAREFSLRHAAHLARLGIEDITHLTPRQAALLAGALTVDAMRYNQTAVAHPELTYFHPCLQEALTHLAGRDALLGRRLAGWEPAAPRHARGMDQAPVERYLDDRPTADNPLAEDGVCRNYTETFQAAWEALRAMQRPGASLLDNTFVKMPMGDYHIWIALYTLQPDGSLLGTQLDPTWADNDRDWWRDDLVGELSGPGPGGYAVERARFALQDLALEASGLSKRELLTNYYAVWLAAHDLAARGRASDGALLLQHWLSCLPDVSGQDLRYWTEQSFESSLRPGKRSLPGGQDLARAFADLPRSRPIS